jgi:hypothetical protein
MVNCCASAKAFWGYASARVRGVPLRWLKTEHAYPTRAALVANRRSLGEVLVASAYLSQEQLDEAVATQPAGLRLGEHLIRLGLLTEEELYEALSLQHDLPAGRPQDEDISAEVTRAIPAELARRWKVLPFRVVAGQLYVASPEVPGEQMMKELKEFWPLGMRFHLVNPRAFKQLMEEYLPVRPPTPVPGFLTGLGLLASLVAITRAFMTPRVGEHR